MDIKFKLIKEISELPKLKIGDEFDCFDGLVSGVSGYNFDNTEYFEMVDKQAVKAYWDDNGNGPKVFAKIYLMVDRLRNKASVTVEDSSETAQVCGLRDIDGKLLHFESDAYHIPTWCKDNNIVLKVVDKEEKFWDLWEKA